MPRRPAPRARLRLVILSSMAVAFALAACEDEPQTVPAPTTSGPTSATVGASASGTTTTSGATGGAGSTGATGGSGAGGDGTGGGGAGGCPSIFIGDGVSATCASEGTASLPQASTSLCPVDSSQFWPAEVYAVTVAAGDCLHMQADNAGSQGADLFGAIVDPSGSSLLFDEERPCTVPVPSGYACPAGAVTIEQAGTAYVVVGAFEGDGCPVGESTPYQLSVAIDGVDVDLSSGPLCADDLLTIIP